MQPLQRFGALEVKKCNPYNVLEPLSLKNATPTGFWSPWGAKMEPLQRSWAPGEQKCNPCSVLGPWGARRGGGVFEAPPPFGGGAKTL